MTTSTATSRLPDPRPDGWPAYPAAAAVLLYLAGWAAAAFALPPAGLLAACGVAAVAVAVSLRAVFHWSTVGPALCTEATLLGPLTVATAAGWLLLPAGDPLERAGWLLLWWGAVTAWWCALCLRVPAAVAAERATPTVVGAVTPDDGGPYGQILTRAGLAEQVTVTGVRTVGAGLDVVTLEPRPGGKTVTFSQLQGKLELLATEATMHWRDHGHDLADGDVSVHPGRNLAEFVLHVARVRTLAGPDAVPVVTPTEPRSWCGPHTLGMYEDAAPLEVVFCEQRRGGRHGEIIGQTGSGKGVSLNNVIAAAVACNDVAVWLIGTEKLTKLAWGWCRPYLSGQTAAPVIDRVAGPRVRDALAGLVDAYHYAVQCNDGEMSDDARIPAPGQAALLVIIDEASDLLERRDRIRCHDGVERNASELVSAIRKIGRSAPVQVFTANQDNLFDSAGTAGSKGKRNSSIAIVGQVRTAQDATQPLAALPARVDPTKLTDNQVYVETGDDSHRAVRAKVRALYGEDRTAAYAAACSGWQTGLIPAYAARLQHYAGRWNPLRHEALVAGVRARGWTWPAGPATLNEQTAAVNPPTEPAPEATVTSDNSEPDRQTGPPDRATGPGMNRTAGPVHGPAGEPGTGPDRTAGGEPPNWSASDAGWLAALGITLDGPGSQEADGPAGRIPEVDVAGVRAAAEKVLGQHMQRIESAPEIPAPLAQAIGLAASAGAPEFIPTATIALAIGRIEQSTPADERNRVVAALGREITAQGRGVGLESAQRSMGSDAEGKRIRAWGFDRDTLLAAARQWWKQAS